MTPEATLQAKRHAHALFRGRPCVLRSFRTVLDRRLAADHPLKRHIVYAAPRP